MAQNKTRTNPMQRNYTAGLDIGNGYVKGLIENTGDTTGGSTDIVDIPSAVTQIVWPNHTPVDNEDAVGYVNGEGAENFFNTIDVSFHTPLVSDNYRRLVGVRSLTAKGALDQFSLGGSKKSKAEQELSKVLVLSNVVSKAVKDTINDLGRVPDPTTDGAIVVHVTAALALPIEEFNSHRGIYAGAFTGHTGSPSNHQVIVNNFATPITVQVVFDRVEVIAEGASAQYAITAGGEPLMDALLTDVRSKGLALEGITSADVLAAQHTVGVDIGEGTVNFPVFTGGRFNADASRSLAKGYGTVLEDALVYMDEVGQANTFSSRKQLAEYLQTPPNALKRNFYNKVNGFVGQSAHFFVREVAEAFGDVLSDVGAQTEVAYVFGGGSGPLREELHRVLLDKAAEMNSEDTFPVLYLDSSYSRKLNREGLMLAARTVAAKR